MREGDSYIVRLDGFERTVPLRRAGSTLIAYLDFLNDRALVRACADGLSTQLRRRCDFDLLLAPEAGAIALCFLVAERLDVPHVIARKRSREYLAGVSGVAVSVPVQSITAPQPEALVLDPESAARLAGRRVVLLDTVVSTGSTLAAVERLADLAGATVVGRAVAFTEGIQPNPTPELVSLSELPAYPA